MKPLLAFGEALIDLLQDPDHPGLYRRNAGGAPANVAVGFARLGGAAAFMGMLGRDAFGDVIEAELSGHGVATGYAPRTAAAPTALAVVSLDPHGERSFGFYRPPAADLLMTPELVDAAAFSARPYFHFGSNSMTHQPCAAATLHALALAEAHGCLVSFDPNWRAALWPGGADARAAVLPLLAHAHVLKFSAAEWEWLGGDALAPACFAGATELIAITDGAQPVRTLTRRGPAWHPVAPCRVVDSTAAGDAFVAGLLWRFAADNVEPQDAGLVLADAGWLARQVNFASRCGALACASYGAFAAMPTLEQVDTRA